MLDAFLSLLAFALAILVVWKLPDWSGLKRRLAAVDGRTEALQKMSARFGLRQTRLTGELADAASERARAEHERAAAASELRTAEAMNEAALRIVDDDHGVPGATVWLFLMANRKPESMVAKGGGTYHYDHSWAQPQSVLVAAPTLERARALVEQRFPSALGFGVVKSDAAPPHLARMFQACAPAGAHPA